MFHISVIEFVQAQSFAQKTSNLGPKMPYMGIFNLKLEKTILGVWRQHPWTFENWKFRAKP